MTTAYAGHSSAKNEPSPTINTDGTVDGTMIDDDPAITVFPDHTSIAKSDAALAQALRDGRALFQAKFNIVDGAGRPFATGDSKPTPRLAPGAHFSRIAGPDAAACSGCHNDPVVGGSGDSAANVFVGAHFTDPPTRDASPNVTNERNTVSMQGSGLIERVAAEMTGVLQALRDEGQAKAQETQKVIDIDLVAKGVSFGSIRAHPNGYIDYRKLEGVDHDLIIKPFGIRGVAISLREFTVAALNQHHGMQAVERFGWERTGVVDFDRDGVEEEFSLGQVTALTLFQADLAPPRPKSASIAKVRRQERRGQELFGEVGCTDCHRSLPLEDPVFREPNLYNRPGTLSAHDTDQVVALDLSHHAERTRDGRYVVHAFTDLKRHDMCDNEVRFFCNERLRQDNVPLELFMTQKLWDLATSAPYGHRGDCSTLSQVIVGHGGEARQARDAYLDLPRKDRRAILSYLKTLGRADAK
ncbi:MAG: di-heme oxidoredictase family protein [Myxococcota bacterium]